MGTIAAAVRELIALGVQGDALVAAVERIEAAQAPAPETPEERKKRVSRETSARHRVSRNVTNASPNVTGENVTKRHQTSPGDTNASPLARREDNPLKLVDTGLAVVVDEACADDWPAGDAGEHARLLCAEANSHRLDPNRAAGLVTTRGRIAAWRRDGASWRFDVLPTVIEMVRKQGPPVSVWTYFDRAIGQSIANNRRALDIPAHATARPPPASVKFNARQANMERALAGAESAAGGRDHATG